MPNIRTEKPPKTDIYIKCLAILALAFVLFGTKVIFIRNFGSMIPYWDQWDAETELYKSYLSSKLTLSALLSSHNEHRILISRVFWLILFELNGSWNPMLQMVANAAVHVGAIVVLVLMLQKILRPAQLLPLVLISAIVFGLPIGWENLLVGFQSQFYFLLVFSLLALAGFATSPAFSPLWLTGLLCSTAAYLSMASGALTTVTAVTVILVQQLLGVRKGAREIGGVALFIAVSIVMILCIVHVAGHEIYNARGVGQLLKAFLTYAAYPRTTPIAAILINLPLISYACFVLVRRPQERSPHWAIFAIILWLFGQALSLSYGRAVIIDSSRYRDIIIIALPLNFVVLLFAQGCARAARQQIAAGAATIVWLVFVMPALLSTALTVSVPSMVTKGAEGTEQRNNVAEYLRSGNIAVLQGKPSQAIPYPDPERLASSLSDPAIRPILPASIRPAEVNEREVLDRTISKGKFRSASSLVREMLLEHAPSIVGLGIALAFAVALLQQYRRQESLCAMHAAKVDPQNVPI
jgi:hypothetical protein